MLCGYWFIIEQDLIWLVKGENSNAEYLPELIMQNNDLYFLVGHLQATPCYVAERKHFSESQVQYLTPIPFRQAYFLLGPELFKLAIRAKALLNWLISHEYCGLCGEQTILAKTELARQCVGCAHLFYPQTSPSVIVLIQREHEVLLARSPRFLPGVYSAVSGFIEPGETAEDALEREVFEEVSIKICNIRYVASQHWPFPNSFMLGFFADYASGEIQVDNIEIIDAQWFNKNNLPVLPTYASIARRLIEGWLNEL